MDIVGTFLTFTVFWKISSCLQCYSCDDCPVNFDMEASYLTDCQHSTMCFKRISTLDFSNGKTSQAIQRGCAAQTQDGEQIKVNRKWISVQNIYEVYEEGCFEDPSNAERITKTLHCYCRGDKCNNAVIHKNVIGVFLMAIVVMIFS